MSKSKGRRLAEWLRNLDSNSKASSDTIADGSISTAKLQTDAVTNAKIADGAVHTANLADANVTFAKLHTDVTITSSTGISGSNDNDTTVPTTAALIDYVGTQIQTKDNSDEITEGSTNLYYTDARVASYLSTNGYGTSSSIIASITDSAPTTLDTLNELAAALGDDANFSTTTATSLGNRLRIDTASQGLTGTQQTNALTNLGITATVAELNYVDGVTSNIQTQLDAKGTSSFSGAYADLTGKPTIPTNNNQLTNGAGYITSFDITTQTDSKYLRSDTSDTFTGNLTIASGSLTLPGGYNLQWGAGYNSGKSTIWSNGAASIIRMAPTGNSSGKTLELTATDNISYTPLLIDADWDTGSYIEALTLYGTYPSYAFRSTTSSTTFLQHLDASGHLTWYFDTSGNTGTSWSMKAKLTSSGVLTIGSSGSDTVWSSGNDGSGSGLDADTVDGIQGSNLLTLSGSQTITGVKTFSVASGNIFKLNDTNATNATNANIYFYFQANGSNLGYIGYGSGSTNYLYINNPSAPVYLAGSSVLLRGGYEAWGADNDGSGSGLDADLLDGQQGSYYTDMANSSGQFTTISATNASSRDKIRVYPGSNYAIGMQDNITYGHLNDWAMTFQMNDDTQSDRGFWWGDSGHGLGNGAMSLTVNGRATIATSLSIGQGESITGPNSTTLYVGGNAYINGATYGGLSIGETPTNYDGWDTQLNVNGSGHSRINVKTANVRMGIYAHDSWQGGAMGHVGTYTNHQLSFICNGAQRAVLTTGGSFSTTVQGTVWGASNDGSGSGLDADTLDGQQLQGLQETYARIQGWNPAYGNSAEASVYYDFSERAVAIHSTTDTSIGAVYKAIPVTAGERLKFNVQVKGDTASSNGLYARIYYYTGNLPAGKTHVSNSATHTLVQEETGGDTSWYENGAITTSYVSLTREWIAPSTGYVSLVILNWTAHGTNKLFVKDASIDRIQTLQQGDRNIVLRSGSTSASALLLEDANDAFRVQLYGAGGDYGFLASEWGAWDIRKTPSGKMSLNNSTSNIVWHAGNDGSGSGLDADTLDGIHKSGMWANMDGAVRTNYTLKFRAPSSGYAGIQFDSQANTSNYAGFFLHYGGTSTSGVYTADGITLVADRGWLTLAQRTTSSKGVRIMSGTTSTERLKVTTAGDIQFVNGNSFTYGGNTIWHAGNDGSGSGLDADTVDGIQGASFLRSDANDTATGGITFNTFTLSTNGTYAPASVGHTASYPEGIFWHNASTYSIYRTSGTWTSPNYQQLKLDWPTGIYLDGGSSYGLSGVRVVGNLLATGNITAYSSDERLKTNITTIDNALNKVLKLRGVTFNWRDDLEEKYNFKPVCNFEHGVIAQEVEKIIPDAITEAPFSVEHTKDTGEEHKFLTVDKEKIIPLLIEAIKEQQAQIEELKEIIKCQ